MKVHFMLPVLFFLFYPLSIHSIFFSRPSYVCSGSYKKAHFARNYGTQWWALFKHTRIFPYGFECTLHVRFRSSMQIKSKWITLQRSDKKSYRERTPTPTKQQHTLWMHHLITVIWDRVSVLLKSFTFRNGFYRFLSFSRAFFLNCLIEPKAVR